MNRRLQMSDRILDLLIFIFFLILFVASPVAFDPLIGHQELMTPPGSFILQD